VDMACHCAPSIYFKPFILHAKPPAIEHYFFVFFSYEQVYPVYYSEGYKIQLIVISEFVFTAQGFLIANV